MIKNKLKYIILFFSVILNSQTKEELLETKVGDINLEIIQQLRKEQVISEFDSKLLGVYIVQLAQEENIKQLTYSELLIKYKEFKNEQKKKVVEINNYGNDSIYIRNPFGEKMFLGMGELSLEKLVHRESMSLPNEYKQEELNKFLTSPKEMVNLMKTLELSPEIAMLFGNVLYIIGEKGEDISTIKIGDYLEIARRINDSKQFKPILENLRKL